MARVTLALGNIQLRTRSIGTELHVVRRLLVETGDDRVVECQALELSGAFRRRQWLELRGGGGPGGRAGIPRARAAVRPGGARWHPTRAARLARGRGRRRSLARPGRAPPRLAAAARQAPHRAASDR